jgi:branched-chain amino acid transport system ATP-binding protein
MLSIENLSKRFGGLQVINNVSFHVKEGEIHSIIGPNGAGKTTLFNLITGLYQPDQGKINFHGTSLIYKKPYKIARMGISRTFQNIRLFPEMSVIQNVTIGQSTRFDIGIRSIFTNPFKKLKDEEGLIHQLDLVNLTTKKQMLAKELSYGERRRLEIARALATGCQLILMDEPAAGMNPDESAQLNEIILKIRDSGVTVLLIEHDMSVVMQISDTVTVINFGEKIAEGQPKLVKENPLVREAYLGKEEEDEAFVRS